jgi:DNA-binding CsgD family transcriptional regulator
VESAIAAARVACDDHRWGDACRLFLGLADDAWDVDDLDRFATAAYLTGHLEEGLARWTRAHQRCVEEGSVHRAAHFGMRLAQSLGFIGDFARCRGWVDRTSRLLEAAGIDCVEQGYLEHALGMGRLFEAGDVPGALAQFEQAGKVAVRFADRELATLARIAAGRMMIYLGDVAEGMARLDEAMVSIEAGELSTIAAGDAYCTVIDACSELSDVVRCRAWTASMRRWCDGQQELVLYRGHCFVHSAEVLVTLGRWHEGLVEARQACDRLAGIVPSVLGAATCLEGDLLRLLGDDAAAEAAYERANDLGHEPQPGLALLRLTQGQVEVAVAMMRRVLAQAEGPASRGGLLGPYVEIVLAAGDVDGGRSAGDELRTIANELGSAMLGARAARADGAVRLASGDSAGALRELRRAFVSFCELGVPHDATRTRLLIADACEALGDQASAAMERDAAKRALTSFGAPDATDLGGGDLPDGLTERELDVLRLLASGATNRAIGEELFISERTVASHVSHIFTKLGVGSRSAATAYAYGKGLLT